MKPSTKKQLQQVIKENEVAIAIILLLLMLIVIGHIQETTPEMR